MKRNIIFITADQMRADCLGFQGKFPTQTPHMDRLAKEGTIFSEAYCSNPLCVPSRAAIMTGRLSFQTGVYYNNQPWARGMATLPGELAKNGYYTVALGKMHFLPERRHAGFHKVINEADHRDYLKRKKVTEIVGMPDTTSWDEGVCRLYGETWRPDDEWDDYEPVFHTNNALKELQQLVDRRDCTGEASEPFFMWLSYLRPHTPCCPPPKYAAMYRKEELPPLVKTEEEKQSFARPLREFAKGWEALSDELIDDFRTRYLGDVTVVDEQIGRVLEMVENLNLADNTLIIVSSDHGEYLGDHHMQQKAYFHDAASKVPFIFYGPGIKSGHVADQNVSLVDLFPTLLDYCGLLPPSRHDDGDYSNMEHPLINPEARSLLPALRGEKDGQERVILSETAIYGQGIMAKIGSHKYNYYPQTEEFDFFDLDSDPDEVHNLGQSLTFETLPPVVREAFSRVLACTKPMEAETYSFLGKIRPMFT